jgi:hypothetical protein
MSQKVKNINMGTICRSKGVKCCIKNCLLLDVGKKGVPLHKTPLSSDTSSGMRYFQRPS